MKINFTNHPIRLYTAAEFWTEDVVQHALKYCSGASGDWLYIIFPTSEAEFEFILNTGVRGFVPNDIFAKDIYRIASTRVANTTMVELYNSDAK